MTTQLKWRLGKLPTPDEVLKLVNDKLITKEEARDILFNEETEEVKSIDDLKQEIKFLKELIEKLGNRSQIVEHIRYIEKPYYIQPWYQPYQVWCGGTITTTGTSGTMYLSNDTTTTGASFTNSDVSFTAIG